MGARGRILQLLDRPSGRRTLAALSSWGARRMAHEDLEIFFDGVWIYRLGNDYCAESPTFSYTKGWPSSFKQRLLESADFWFHAYQSRPGDVILDIGAGTGIDSLVFSRAVGPQGKVLAVEAHPMTYRCLQKQCQWNRLSNTIPLNCAIVDKRGLVYIEDRADHQANTVSKEHSSGRLAEGVAGITLDELCREQGINRVDFLKMNIEGAELLALEGMREMIGMTENVCIACHDFLSGPGADRRIKEQVVRFLKENGFAIHLREDDSREYVRDHVHGVRREGGQRESP